jgi:hypothetical protein
MTDPDAIAPEEAGEPEDDAPGGEDTVVAAPVAAPEQAETAVDGPTTRRATKTAAFAGLAALAFFEAARAIEASVARLHMPGQEGAAYASLGNPGKVEAAWATWIAGRDGLRELGVRSAAYDIRLHAILDSLFVLAVVVMAVALPRLEFGEKPHPLARLNGARHRPWVALVLGAAVVSWIGNAFECYQIEQADIRAGLAQVVRYSHIVELVVVALALAALIAPSRDQIRRGISYLDQSPALERLLLVLVVLVAVVLNFGRIGAQAEDLIERWVLGDWAEGLAVLGGLIAFTTVVILAGTFEPPKVKPDGWTGRSISAGLIIVPGALVTGVGVWVWRGDEAGRGAGMFVLGGILLLVGVFTALGPYLGAREDTERALPAEWLRIVLVAAPWVLFGLVCIRTSVANQVVAGRGGQVLGLAGIGLVGLAAGGALGWLSRSFSFETAADWRWAAPAFVALGGASVVLVHGSPDALGTFGVVMAMLVLVVCIGALLRMVLGDRPVPAALRLIGFRRTPTITLLVAWMAVASTINGSTNTHLTGEDDRVDHQDARTELVPEPVVDADAGCLSDIVDAVATEELKAAFCRWYEPLEGTAPSIPLVLASASGGGVRAAAWTEQVLDCLFLRGDPVGCEDAGEGDERWRYLFAANGTSGGSVGIASTVAERLVTPNEADPDANWDREHLSDTDALSPTVSRALLHDGLFGLFGLFLGDDRAATLAHAWADRWSDDNISYCGDAVDGDLEATGIRTLATCDEALPLLLFNGADTSTGKRVDIAAADYDGSDPTEERSNYDAVDALGHRDGEVQDLPLFTAAFLSARFPLVSSTGRLPSCTGDECPSPTCPDDVEDDDCPETSCREDDADCLRVDDEAVLNIVDGGYVENSGTGQLLDMVGPLQSIIGVLGDQTEDETEADDTPPPVRLVFVEIENGEVGAAAERVLGTGGSELVRPVQAITAAFTRGHSTTAAAMGSNFRVCSQASTPEDPEAAEAVIQPDDAVSGGEPARVHLVMYEHPGRRLPLGWTLSGHSLADVERQFHVDQNQASAACFAALVP